MLTTGAKQLVIGLLLGSSIVAGGAIVMRRPGGSVHLGLQPSSAAVEKAQLEARIASIETRLATLAPARPSSTTAAEPIGSEPPAVKAATTKSGKKRSPARAQSSSSGTRDNLESAMQAEQLDPVWGPAFERQLADILGERFPSARLLATSCRSTICRVDLEHDTNSNARMFIQRFPFILGLPSPSFLYSPEPTEEGPSSAVLFVVRPGHRFPEGAL
jgi:hypothetical protein